ncbi:hypothetical protein PHJA_002987800 [Phtheirospermum japonicum]|uniref:Uncharacterized protein n=1 Tax=Phtheirospermum japonicum TaxID=374723 RepID=A0A830D7C1_9LAMI|nr:hypothetical protein PHJA_002987800 [Phtheirospermum japonicum]
MSCMNRIYMAASVAVVNTHADQGQKLNSALKSLNHARKQFFSGGPGPDAVSFRPFSSVLNSSLGGFIGGGDEQRKQADESIRQVMYFNCWGQG